MRRILASVLMMFGAASIAQEPLDDALMGLLRAAYDSENPDEFPEASRAEQTFALTNTLND